MNRSFYNIDKQRIATGPRPAKAWPYIAWDAGGMRYDVRKGSVHGWKAITQDYRHVHYGRTLAELSHKLEMLCAIRER